ncbi:site-specific integrase [Pseudoflavonifractor sp. 60]|uniref:tyrosine-type recombinase/integrase n=1 Tax=Pseudoflavonifractor sp. 60 TaxID=2304576 RepID=UPI00136FDCE8|nr:site-specific integrase [Pseudoflavonifractor sp. 60]NBI67306.1 site-specific integrase [Pseudoflavonifractor sp. 60]
MVAGHLQIKKDYYYMVLNLKDEQGRRKSKWLPTGIQAVGKKKEKRAQDMLLETRCSYKEPVIRSAELESARMSNTILFADYMLNWLSIIKNSVEEVTYAGYEGVVTKRIVPYFRKMGVTLGNLTALDIERFYEYCFDTLGIKGSTVQHYHANLHKALKYAVKHNLIDSNPMEKVERPKSQKFVGSFYSVTELEQLFQVAKGDTVEFPILMAAFYGLRRSEIMGLRWQAIDFVGNTIMIDHTVVQFRSKGKTRVVQKDRTKNVSSCRSLPLVPQYRELLLRMKERQEQCRKLCGNCYIESDYIYVNDLGAPYQPNFVSQHFRTLLEKNRLRVIRFHDLRHTCASLLLKNGVSMKEIQEWLGHSNFSTTANTYAHLDTAAKNTSAAKMDKAISIAPGIQASPW